MENQAAIAVAAQLETALTLWRDAIGADYVVAAGDELAAANLATFTPSGKVVAIIRPSSTEEVQECLRIAHALRVPVHAVSRGRNWCFGSRTPPLGVAVLMELSRMNQIVAFSEDLAYVRVQPGVTFEQLADFLEGRQSRLQIEATSGPPDGSVIGNALERGRSHGPIATAGRPVGDFEVVLADGRLIHTSTRRFPNARHGPCEPFPLGPDSTGLFFESNVGVVTELTLWLARKPSHSRVLRLGLSDQKSLERTIAPIRDLMMDGVLTAGDAFLMNETRRQHGLRAGSYHGVPRSYQLRDRDVDGIERPAEGLPLWPALDLAWLCTVTLYASDRTLAERRFELVKETLMPFAAIAYEGVISNVGARPSPEYARNPLWRKRTSQPPDLDRDRVGYIAIAPVVPAVAEEVTEVYETMVDSTRAHGFEPFVNLRFWDARSLLFVGSLVYDLEEPGADERAIGCFESIAATLNSRGYFYYRLPTFAMQKLPEPSDAWGSFWADVKHALDPHDILSPGRYDFRYCWP